MRSIPLLLQPSHGVAKVTFQKVITNDLRGLSITLSVSSDKEMIGKKYVVESMFQLNCVQYFFLNLLC